jgi:hypothetical protein
VEISAGAVVERSSLALDAQGQPAVLFELFTSGETSSSNDLYFARYGVTGWSNVQYVTGADVIKPSLGFDAQGELWATWQNIATSTTRKIFLQRLTGTPLSATLERATDAVFASGGVGAPALLVLEDDARALRVVRRQ